MENPIKIYQWENCPERYKIYTEKEFAWVAVIPQSIIKVEFPSFLLSSDFNCREKIEKPGFTILFGDGL